MFHHILVAVDGSAQAEQALVEAIDLAETQHASLTILTAVPHVLPVVSVAGVSPVTLAHEVETESEAILRSAVDTVPDDISVTKVLTREPVREALIEQVETERFDLVVMGSRGRGTVRSALLGSVSHHMVNHSAVPVLVVHIPAH